MTVKNTFIVLLSTALMLSLHTIKAAHKSRVMLNAITISKNAVLGAAIGAGIGGGGGLLFGAYQGGKGGFKSSERASNGASIFGFATLVGLVAGSGIYGFGGILAGASLGATAGVVRGVYKVATRKPIKKT